MHANESKGCFTNFHLQGKLPDMGKNAEKLQKRNRELSILNNIAQVLNQSVDINQVLRDVLAKVAELLDLQTGWVWLLREDDEDASYLAAFQNLPPVLENEPERMEGVCYCLRTFREGDLDGAANVNVVECSRLQGLVDGTNGLRYHASIPLYAHGKKLGVLNVAGTDWRQLSPDDLQLLITIGDMLGIAVERVRLFDQSLQLGAVKERNRLAREIHDTLAQGLTAVSLQLESADALLEADADPQKIRRYVQHALSLTQENLEEARRSVMDLRAAPLEGRTLPEAMTELADGCSVPTQLDITGSNQPLPPRVEIGVYRIAQEALTNIEQHAQAKQAQIKLAITPQGLQLTITDDGIGFDTDAVPRSRFGLVGLNERVRLLNGRLHLHSSPGQGTQLDINIPLA